jgi:hypothetical protein
MTWLIASILICLAACDAPPGPPPALVPETIASEVCAMTYADGFVYWSVGCDGAPDGQIFRREIEGGGVELVASGLVNPEQLEVDGPTYSLSVFTFASDLGLTSSHLVVVDLISHEVKEAILTTWDGGMVEPTIMLGGRLALAASARGEELLFILWRNGLEQAPVVLHTGLVGTLCSGAFRVPVVSDGSRVVVALERGGVCRTVASWTVLSSLGFLIDLETLQTRFPIVGLFDGLPPLVRDGSGALWLEAATGDLTALPAGEPGLVVGSPGGYLWLSEDYLQRVVASDGSIDGTWTLPTPDSLIMAHAFGPSLWLLMLRQGELSVVSWPPA